MPSSPKILVVDSERISRQVLTAILEDMCDVLLAATAEQAMERLRQVSGIDLILAGVSLPDMDGYEFLREIKANPEWHEIPFVVVTSSQETELEELAFSLGAADFIVKPVRASTARARIALQLRLVAQHKVAQELAQVDGLTGIANRRRLDQTLRSEWARAARHGLPLSVIMLDVDHFKAYNDTTGHQQGDEVLRQVASALQETCSRTGDLVARYGGEEFAVVLPDTPLEGGLEVGQMLCRAVEALAIPHPKSSASAFVTVSVGGATSGHGQKTADALLEQADEVLYRSKLGGRNRVNWAVYKA